ncbi:MAG: PH domain-containing protein [Halanaerobiales bacterium]|nr:PH domain-containing protein [Halanaerobiales bacterium]
MADLNQIMTWTFVKETEAPSEVKEILIDGEKIEAAYKTVRDVAVITNKRIIVADKQGLTGKKVEIYTIPFKSIVIYSSENARGILDFNAEIQLWTRAGTFKLNLKKGINIRKIDRLIAQHIL